MHKPQMEKGTLLWGWNCVQQGSVPVITFPARWTNHRWKEGTRGVRNPWYKLIACSKDLSVSPLSKRVIHVTDARKTVMIRLSS